MQSTGHSSMQALSLRSTQGWAMMYVTGLTPRTTHGWCAYTSNNTPSPESHAHRCPWFPMHPPSPATPVTADVHGVLGWESTRSTEEGEKWTISSPADEWSYGI